MGRATPLMPGAAADGGGRRAEEQKTSWPEVVGWVMLNAADQINLDRPDVFPAFYSETTPLPTNYDPKRVIIVGDDGSVVVRTPVIG